MRFWPVLADDSTDYPITDHGFDTQQEAERAIADFWSSYFEREPDGSIPYVSTEIRVTE